MNITVTLNYIQGIGKRLEMLYIYVNCTEIFTF